MTSSPVTATNLASIETRIIACESGMDYLKTRKKDLKQLVKESEQKQKVAIQALTVSQEVAQQTQKELEIQISNIVTSAIQAIFNKPYEFRVDFQVRRNKTEADIYLTDEDGNRFNPIHDNGGGIADIIAFSLRLACWRLNNPRTCGVVIYDECLKFVSKNYIPAVVSFVKEICEKLDLQIIMITHIEQFIESADNIIEIK